VGLKVPSRKTDVEAGEPKIIGRRVKKPKAKRFFGRVPREKGRRSDYLKSKNNLMLE
jgi:hypothetical protein